jgi:SAM-dependent methyltransferase
VVTQKPSYPDAGERIDMLEPSCAICSADTERLFTKNNLWIRQCVACGHQQAEIQNISDHVDRVYGDDYFFGAPDGYPNYLDEAELLVDRGRWYARQLSQFTRPGTVLDVGAAAGFVLQGYVESGWSGVGLEPNERMAAHARDELGIEVIPATLETWKGRRQFDLVSMIQVIAHFVSPKHAFEIASECLVPQGLLVVEMWDRKSLPARIFGKAWHEYNPPSVLHWFSEEGLRDLAAASGFGLIARGRPPKQISGSHARHTLYEQFAGGKLDTFASNALGLIPDDLVLPYPSLDLRWLLFQKAG